MKAGRNTIHFFILLLSALFLFSSATQARGLPDFTDLVEQNAPAVVNISTRQHADSGSPHGGYGPELQLPENSPFNDLFRHFFEGPTVPRQRESQSLGSGFIISKDGYILTNYHVVEDADEVIVQLNNRKTFEAEVIGSDQASDIALLKIDSKNLPTVKMGKSSELKIGEWVLAIGSPFGFEATVTAGIVSAKRRALPSENYVPYIQTDVAINPGNSGGPLFNMEGEVVGINSQIYSRSGGFMGLSFAVPIELAINVADQLRTSGHVKRGYLGVLIQDVDRDLAESFGMNHPKGALVTKVLPDSPASKAGLMPGDVILEFNGHELRDSTQLPPMVGTTPIGAEAKLNVLREGKTKEVSVKIGELPDEEGASEKPKPQKSKGVIDDLGLSLVEPSKQEREELGLPLNGGILVEDVKRGAASKAGIRAGDLIMMLDGKKVSSVEMFRDAIKGMPSGKTVALLVHKRNGPVFIAMRLP